MRETDTEPSVSWRWLNWSIVIVCAGAVVMIGLISAGVFDPKPLGPLKSSQSLPEVSLEAGQHRLEWLDQAAPESDYSLRLTAALAEGEVDSAYGLALGNQRHYLAVAVSPVGYVSLWRQEGERSEALIPWRTWPHIHLGQETNEIWLDVQDGRLTSVRTNREILWQGKQAAPGSSTGLWAETFGEAAAIDFRQLDTFAEPTPTR